MLNDRNDKYEGHQAEEEGEYHFSEDEVSYEVEPEPSKTPPAQGFKETFLNQARRSKRLLIGLGIFIFLIMVVYKMVSPSSTAPAEIVSQAPTNTVPVNSSTAAPAPQVVVVNQAPVTPASTAQAVSKPSAGQIVSSTTMPAVVPVQTPTAYPNKEISSQPATAAELRMAALVAENEKLMTQLQTNYVQKLNDFAAQTKALQDQIQLINGRVANIEGQMNQLVQTITTQIIPNNRPAAATPPPSSIPAGPKISYNVQAIIPGRAWLKSESGETLTVAEGDTIKEVGRVTKIDPYDGIVEINTGSKVVSLSYGTSG